MTNYTSQGTISVRIDGEKAVLFFVPTSDYSYMHRNKNLAVFSRGTKRKPLVKKFEHKTGGGIKVKIGGNKKKRKKWLIAVAKTAAEKGTRVEIVVRKNSRSRLKLTSIRLSVK